MTNIIVKVLYFLEKKNKQPRTMHYEHVCMYIHYVENWVTETVPNCSTVI